jgi:uncharacterized protein
MPRNVIIVHGGDSFDTYQHYLSSLTQSSVRFRDNTDKWKSTLQYALGDSYNVLIPEFPNKQNAQYLEWKIIFDKIHSYINEQTILVGHSLGGIFLTQYLSEHPLKISQLHLVAAVYGKEGSFISPKDFLPIQVSSQSVHIWHSIDDTVVPFDHALSLKKAISKAELHQFVGKGHFNQTTFPELIEVITST